MIPLQVGRKAECGSGHYWSWSLHLPLNFQSGCWVWVECFKYKVSFKNINWETSLGIDRKSKEGKRGTKVCFYFYSWIKKGCVIQKQPDGRHSFQLWSVCGQSRSPSGGGSMRLNPNPEARSLAKLKLPSLHPWFILPVSSLIKYLLSTMGSCVCTQCDGVMR